MESYDYANRKGIREITWEEFGVLSAELAKSLSSFEPQVVIGIARAGLFPATAVACMLRLELIPVKLSRRENDQIIHSTPVWKVPIMDNIRNKTVAIIDEIADTGQTLSMVKEEVYSKGAQKVISASLISHSWANPAPEISVFVSDELIIFPWDRKVWLGEKWQIHPEIADAIHAQELSKAPAKN
jgi:hypoxanthine phosphoribosyltransferase